MYILALKLKKRQRAALPFTIGIYGSPGSSSFQPTELLQTYAVTDPTLLAGGDQTYTVTFAGDPGQLDTNCFLVADLDVYNNVRETSKADNVSAPLSGVFQTGDGTVYAYSPAGDPSVSNTVLVSEDQFGNVTVAVNGTDYTFSSVSGVTIGTPTGDNTINGDFVSVPLTIYGGAGGDWIVGGAGGDTFYGGAAGGNHIEGGNGGDTIYGGQGGGNAIYGGTGDDTIYGQGTVGNTIIDIDGNNTIYAGDGGDTITCGNWNNQVFGGAGNDTITVGNGKEFVQAGSGNATINGGTGSDWLCAGSGNDTINGGYCDERHRSRQRL